MAGNTPEIDEHSSTACDTKSDKERQNEQPISIWMVAAVAITILGSGFPSGYCLTVINTPQEIMQEWIKSATTENTGYTLTRNGEIYIWAITVSIFIVGAAIGSPLAALIADKYGRRFGLLLNHLNFILAASLLAGCKSANSIYLLIAGRFISGISTGLSSSLMTVYLSEIAPTNLRGVMGVLFNTAVCLGELISLILGMESILGTREYWPYLVGGFGIPAALAVIMHPALPESPAYCFIVLGDEVKGRKALYHLRGGLSKSVAVEEVMLTSHMQKNSSGNHWSLMNVIKNRKYCLPLIIAIVFNIGQQFSGINAVFYYSTMIFRSAGLSISESQGASIGAATINCILSLLSVPLIRYTRRRVLMLCSTTLCIVCLTTLMTSLALISTISYASYAAMAAMMCYVFSFGLGMGPIPYMVSTELFPPGPRSIGIAAGTTSNWVSNLVVGLTFPLIQAQIGEYSFLCFILSTCMLGIFTYKCLPETLGKDELDPDQNTCIKSDISLETPTKV